MASGIKKSGDPDKVAPALATIRNVMGWSAGALARFRGESEDPTAIIDAYMAAAEAMPDQVRQARLAGALDVAKRYWQLVTNNELGLPRLQAQQQKNETQAAIEAGVPQAQGQQQLLEATHGGAQAAGLKADAQARAQAAYRPHPAADPDSPTGLRTTSDLKAIEGGLPAAPPAGSAPTLAQQANNAEVDAARETLTKLGLSHAEIIARMQKASDTGMPNNKFDPFVERLARIASQRKTGPDPDFETTWRSIFNPAQPAAPAPGSDPFGLRAAGSIATPLPMAGGKIDAAKLKVGDLYEHPRLGPLRWTGRDFEPAR
jgi:hypothetical protein